MVKRGWKGISAITGGNSIGQKGSKWEDGPGSALTWDKQREKVLGQVGEEIASSGEGDSARKRTPVQTSPKSRGKDA